MELRSLRERLKMRVAAELDLTRDVEDAEIARMIDRCILEETKDQYVPLKEKVGLRVELFNSLRRLDVLTELLEDETVTEIMVNGQSDIFVERDGVIRRYEKGFSSEERLETVIQHIVGDCNRRINAASPIVDARLMDGSRVCIVTRPVSLGGPVITIRRFPKQRIDMKALIAMGSVDAGVASVLRILVQAGYNIFISGGTGSGKTSALEAIRDLGGRVIDCDEVYHEMLRDSAELRHAIEVKFHGVFNSDGTLNRKKLGELVFENKERMAQLNEVIYRFIVPEVQRRCQAGELVAVDAINLIESGAEALCDRTVAVTAPAELRVRRIMARDGIDERYARMRISAQKSDEFYRGKCDYELSNTAETPEDFREIARDFFRRLIGELREEKNEASR